jgi:hypothetical protein
MQHTNASSGADRRQCTCVRIGVTFARTSRALVLTVSVTYTSGPLHALVQTGVNALTCNIPPQTLVQTGVNALTLRIGASRYLKYCGPV